jgi:phosphoribosylformimino-5-aminoimidazole carboxamide ribotide isomerase
MDPQLSRPRLIPVLDVMNGQVVRAIGGRRHEYQPIVSRVIASTHPVVVAGALLARTAATELYIADLDAICGGTALAPEIERVLRESQSPAWLDIGINAQRSATLLSGFSTAWPVVGLETGAGPQHLEETLAAAGPRPVAVSLDLRAGELLGQWQDWSAGHSRDAITVVRTAIRCGAKAIIVLDLSRVGTGSGTGTELLLRLIRNEFPGIDLIAGGGVRTWDDVDRLGDAGATGVLVASALHDGTLTFPRPAPGEHHP